MTCFVFDRRRPEWTFGASPFFQDHITLGLRVSFSSWNDSSVVQKSVVSVHLKKRNDCGGSGCGSWWSGLYQLLRYAVRIPTSAKNVYSSFLIEKKQAANGTLLKSMQWFKTIWFQSMGLLPVQTCRLNESETQNYSIKLSHPIWE